MSFGLYFLRLPPDGRWDGVLAALEEQAGSDRPLSAQDLDTWRSIETGVRSVLPDAEGFEGENNRELTDEGSGIQLSMFPGELSLSVPYWYSGPDAESLVAVLRRVVGIVERSSGLVAYDPQAEAPFLEADPAAAVSSFDMVHESFAKRGIRPGRGTIPSQAPTSIWRRLFKRKP